MRDLVDLWVDVRSASHDHLAVRLSSLAGALLFTLALALAGGGNPAAWALLTVFGGLVVLQPHTLMPGLFLVFAAASWWAGVDGGWHWALLPAALGLLLVHVGAALAASVPAQAPLPASVRRRWAVRTGVVAAVTTGVWGVAGLLQAVATGEGGAVPGIVGLALVAGCLVLYVQRLGRD
ncbi:hypothetical protein [Ornithinimicrobium pekingense]|uniref:Uncharacterized protein n=1 Tax=Ornithinimicrobium pekingense TaxID=384677 RepID=A0ABQ2F6V0_9MICO|nr:hypothetical protein [Ornithinimicrobium pekingense]GGK66540.1 hypothetical protein GCM10011509_13520 [Ornithinimicrobium pekingense]